MHSFSSPKCVEVDVKQGVCKIEGINYPAVGLGTYRLTGKDCCVAITEAAHVGYRIIDTATYYKNFDAIADALKNLTRHDFYIISKVWHDAQAPKELRHDLNTTLKALKIDYLDAYLLHWPNSSIPIEHTLAAMEELRCNKKIRHIGLSNVSSNHLIRALELHVPITWIQVEMSPYFYDPQLLHFCKQHAITVQAWAPLGRGRIHEDPLLLKISQKYGKTPSQIAIRWIIQHGCIPLPGSKNKQHMLENITVTDFTLSKDEMEEIDQRAKGGERQRVNKEDAGFSDEFDFSYEQCWPKPTQNKVG